MGGSCRAPDVGCRGITRGVVECAGCASPRKGAGLEPREGDSPAKAG